MAEVNYNKKDYHEALRNINVALELSPTNNSIVYEKIRILIETDSLDQALVLSRQLEFLPEFKYFIKNIKAKIFFKKKEYASAVKIYTEFIEILKTETKIEGFELYYCFLDRAKCKYYLNDYRSAIDDYESVNFEGQVDGEPIYYYGLSLIEMGSKSEGCGQLSRAGELGYKEAYQMIKSRCKY